MGLPSMQQTFELALQHHQAGRLTEAEPLYRQILAQQPGHAGALQYLGVIARQQGRHDLAVDLICRAIALQPNSPGAYISLGNVLKDRGQLDQAIAAFGQAIALQPDLAEAHGNLGIALQAKGQLEQAIAAFRRAIQLKPGFPEAHNNLGNALHAKGQSEEALAALRQAIALKPNYAEAYSNLGIALKDHGQLDQAIAACRQAIALHPDYAAAYSNLGITLCAQGNLDQAIAACRQAIALKPTNAEAHNNLGVALNEQGRTDEVIAVYRQAIALKPDFADAHQNLGHALLLRGDFAQGWEEFAWRWQCKGPLSPYQNFMQPQWDGSPLNGRTILLHAEQGLGDTIQFIRYMPLVVQRGGRVIVECQAELQRLLQTMAGDIPILARGWPLPEFELHCPLLSLPQWLRTTLATIPNHVPYLTASVPDAAIWQSRLAGHGSTIKIGLLWAGNPQHKNDRHRSMKLANMAPLAQVRGAHFYSLQKGEAATQAKTPPPGMELIGAAEDLKDFADTAGLIANLDLVITVDTAVAHLAGAMGKPVWTLLPYAPDWRWLRDREDSPWYPTMRLFRQPAIGDWDNIIIRVSEALSIWMEKHLRPRANGAKI